MTTVVPTAVWPCASFLLSAVLLRATGSPGRVVLMLALGPLLAAVSIAALFPETSGRELEDEADVLPTAVYVTG
jgi:hypothetical protein